MSNKKPTCDNECAEMGWEEYYLINAEYDLHISVEPNTEL